MVRYPANIYLFSLISQNIFDLEGIYAFISEMYFSKPGWTLLAANMAYLTKFRSTSGEPTKSKYFNECLKDANFDVFGDRKPNRVVNFHILTEWGIASLENIVLLFCGRQILHLFLNLGIFFVQYKEILLNLSAPESFALFYVSYGRSKLIPTRNI